jgi:hypothetical protein
MVLSETRSSLAARGRKDAADLKVAYKELLCLAAVKLDGKWGFIDKAGKFVIEPLYGYVGKFCEGRVSFTKGSLSFKTVPYSHGPGLCSGFYSNCLWGYLDTEGKILVEPSFEEASDFSEGMARVGIDGMFGFVSKDGRIAIEPRFLEARKFDGGLSIVLVEGRWEIDKDSDIGSRMLVDGTWALIDKNGNFRGKSRFEEIENFVDGFACAKQDNKFGFIDRSGEFVIAPRFDQACSFHDGLARIWIKEGCGIIDRSGEFVLDPIYSSIDDFEEGTARASIDGVDLLVDCHGEIRFRGDKDNEEICDFNYGVAMVRSGSGNSFYIDRTGKRLTDASMEAMDHEFREGRGLVRRSGRLGYIDEHGKLVIDTKFVQAGVFHRGHTSGSIDGGKRERIDRFGNFVSLPRWHSRKDLHEGLIRFELDRLRKWGFTDESGVEIIEARFERVGNFSQGLAFVQDESRKWGVIDRSGNFVIPTRFEDAGDFQIVG